MNLTGGCHCGAIRYTLAWPGESIAARACTCSFCTRHGGVWTSHPEATLAVDITAPVSRYTFGTHTATFHVCARCGVVPIVTSDIDGATYAVVNVNTLETDLAITRTPVTHDDASTADRLARRKRNWIASVALPAT